ncbi:MAG: TRAP transporter large permease subunit [Methanotrichaceae archaeon]|nr:TRAP transporter large permease subunit [Methanotrichaceae archaeon]
MSNQAAKRLERVISIIDKSEPFFKALTYIASSIIVITGCLIFADIVLRYVFNSPLKFVGQISALMILIATFFTMTYTQQKKSHISIDFLTQYLSPKGKIVLHNIHYILSIAIIVVMTWQSIVYTLYIKAGNIEVLQLKIPAYPFAAVVPFGFATLIFMLMRDFLGNIVEGMKLHLGSLWLLSFGILTLVMAGIAYEVFSAPFDISFQVLGIVGFVVTIVCFLSGMPISFLLILLGFITLTSVKGLDPTLATLGYISFRTLNSFVWAVIGLFVLMGYIVHAAGFGRDLYYSAYKWLGHLPGGLAVATIGAATGFAATVGDSMSSTVTFGTIALPEMRRYKYNDLLSTGAICLGATLGPMIPPSISFIIYGIVTNQSIGTLFVAGILPGVILSLASMIYVYIVCRRNPSLGPQGPSTVFKEKLMSLRLTWPAIVLFIVVIGGIYSGIFTPNEGGGVGLAGAFIIGLSMMRFKRQAFTQMLLESGKLIGMLFPIIIGALIFGYFIAASRLNTTMGAILTWSNMPSVFTIMIICVIYLILGCFMDPIVILLITLPIFYPTVISLGYDPIWFGVIAALLVNLGMITPPFGVICYALAGVTDVPLGKIFKGSAPFVGVTIAVLVLLIAFPQIATFLPNLLKLK